jgi:hypothetical protein
MSHRSFAAPPATSDADRGLEELELQRTAGLTRMHPADTHEDIGTDHAKPGDQPGVHEGPRTKFEVRIGSMSNGLDGGQGMVEGQVEITEFVNDEYVGVVSVTSTVIVDNDTPLSLIEDRLLNSTKDTLERLAALPAADLRAALDATKQDEDLAYQPKS